MSGVLACRDGEALDWCNAVPFNACLALADLREPDADQTGAIACFVIAPGARRRGGTRALLDAASGRCQPRLPSRTGSIRTFSSGSRLKALAARRASIKSCVRFVTHRSSPTVPTLRFVCGIAGAGETTIAESVARNVSGSVGGGILTFRFTYRSGMTRNFGAEYRRRRQAIGERESQVHEWAHRRAEDDSRLSPRPG